MNALLLALSLTLGLIPFNRLDGKLRALQDYVLMLIVPIIYVVCLGLAYFTSLGLFQHPFCDSICRQIYQQSITFGFILYFSNHLLTLSRRKNFFAQYEQRIQEIDKLIEKCIKRAGDFSKPQTNRYIYNCAAVLVVILFGYGLSSDALEMFLLYGKLFFVPLIANSFPYLAGSIIQGQFIYFVSMISSRFSMVNCLFEKINKECDKRYTPLIIFDIETEVAKENPSRDLNMEIKHRRPTLLAENLRRLDDHSDLPTFGDDKDGEPFPVEDDGPTSEENLNDLFKLHDKVLSLSQMTNTEYGPQCVPFMGAVFVSTLLAIFMQTKVAFVVGGQRHLLDYSVWGLVIWSGATLLVAYLILHFCYNSDSHSKQSAMIVHEIMQKKPTFMLGNDLYYNKMKAFTLQYLHWESFFHYNGLGLFALDYTFIFSTVSAATSYLIVLLQFDMTAILKKEGLV